MADGKITIDTKLDNSGLDKGLKDLNKKLKDTEKEIDSSTKKNKSLNDSLKGIKASTAAATAGFAAAAVAVKKTVDALNACSAAYRTQQKAETALQVAAKNNPYLNGESVDSLKRFASELQSVTEIGDELALQVMSQLAATGRNEEQIRAIMSAAADMAAVTGEDLASAAQKLNATLNGNAGTLGRQIEGINDLTKAELENGKAIELVAAKYKGSAVEMADTTVQLSNAWGDFKENIGRGWENVTRPVKQFFLGVLNDINEATAKTNALKDAKAARDAGKQTAASVKQELEAAQLILDEMAKNKGMTERKGGVLSGMMYDPGWEKKYLEQLDLVNSLSYEYGELAKAEKAEAEAQQKAAEATKAANDAKAEAAQRDKDALAHINANKKALNEQAAAAKLKAELTGEEIDAGEMYNAYLQSYIDLVTKSNGLVTENNSAAQQRIKDLQFWKEAAENAANEEERLAAALEAASAAAKLSIELEQKNRKDNEQLLSELYGEKALTAIDKFKARAVELADLRVRVNQDEIMSAQEKNEALLKLDEDYAQSKKDLYYALTSEINDYTQQTADVAKEMSELMLENLQTATNNELAALEQKYAKGEMAESEYYEKQQEIQRKAAREEYKIKMFEWTASVLTATANIAEGVTKAIAQGGVAGIISGLLVGSAGAIQLSSILAAKPIPPSFYQGGVIGGMNGASMGDDNTYIHARRGEMVMNASQQRALWDMINGQGSRAQLGLNLTVNNTQSGRVDTNIRQENGGYVIDILDKHINKGFSDGTYDAGLAAMNTRQEGVRIL